MRIVLENELKLSLKLVIQLASELWAQPELHLFAEIGRLDDRMNQSEFREWLRHRGVSPARTLNPETGITRRVAGLSLPTKFIRFSGHLSRRAFEETEAFSSLPESKHADDDLLAFFADRLKQVLRDEGKRHDLIDAVFSLGEDDLVLIVKRVEALTDFLATEDGANLLAGYKRAANILKAEEKKDGVTFQDAPKPSLMTEPAERDLLAAIESETAEVDGALKREDFEAAMRHLAKLRHPADEFFTKVMVNTDEASVRANRLNLLAALRAAVHKVADFSKIEG